MDIALPSREFKLERGWTPNHRNAGAWILSHVLRWRNLPLIIGVFAGALGNAALNGYMPLYTGQAFDALREAQPDLALLRAAAIGILWTQVVRALLQLTRNLCSEAFSQMMERDVREELYVELLGKNMAFHDGQAIGDIMARATNDVREINLMFNPGLNMVIGSAAFLFMPLVFIYRIHPQLVLIPLLFLVAYAVLVPLYLRWLRPKSEAVRANFGRMNAALAEAIEGIETVKGAAQEEKERQRFLARVDAWRRAFVAQANIEATFFPLLTLSILTAAGLYQSLQLMRMGQISLGDVIAYSGLMLMFEFPTFTAQFAYARVASGVASAQRILRLITTVNTLDQNPQGYQAPMRGEIRFEGVTFGYDPQRPILREISFSVQPGQTVAIVGQTGAGKSTLTKLINRIYDVQRGRVLVDGVDVRDWNLEALRRQISVIEQDIFLFSRTVAENIAFGRPDASREEIIAAAKLAQAHDFIMEFKDGYDTIVGERGVTLSGGQRQRIAIARAFLTQPAILILDDATSAIDSATEDAIQRAIEAIARGRTTILITHRLSQIRWADQIVVVRHGRVEAVGDHETLMATCAAYRDIFARYEG